MANDVSSDNLLVLHSKDRQQSIQLPIELEQNDPPTPDQINQINRMVDDRLDFFRRKMKSNRPSVIITIFVALGLLSNIAGYFSFMPLAAVVGIYVLGLLLLVHMLRVYLEASRRVKLLEEVRIKPFESEEGAVSLLYLARQYLDKDVPALNIYIERLLIQSRPLNSYDRDHIHLFIRSKFPCAALNILPSIKARDDLDRLMVDDQTRLRLDSIFNKESPSKGAIMISMESALRHELVSKLLKLKDLKAKQSK